MRIGFPFSGPARRLRRSQSSDAPRRTRGSILTLPTRARLAHALPAGRARCERTHPWWAWSRDLRDHRALGVLTPVAAPGVTVCHWDNIISEMQYAILNPSVSMLTLDEPSGTNHATCARGRPGVSGRAPTRDAKPPRWPRVWMHTSDAHNVNGMLTRPASSRAGGPLLQRHAPPPRLVRCEARRSNSLG